MTDDKLVHVVDDDADVRASLSFLLGGAGYEVQSYASGEVFVAALPELAPGCLLLDMRMPGLDGFGVLEALSKQKSDIPAVVLTGHGDIPQAVRAMKAGAMDFLEKPYERAALLKVVERACALQKPQVQKDRDDGAARQIAALSARERQVLQGLVAGLPNKSIAYDLKISPRTVEIHRAHMMEKLGVRALADALRIAFAAGLPPLGDGDPD